MQTAIRSVKAMTTMSHKSKRERKYAASYRADRVDALNNMIAEGGDAAAAANKAKRAMRDTWMRRTSNNVTGFHKPQPRGAK